MDGYVHMAEEVFWHNFCAEHCAADHCDCYGNYSGMELSQVYAAVLVDGVFLIIFNIDILLIILSGVLLF